MVVPFIGHFALLVCINLKAPIRFYGSLHFFSAGLHYTWLCRSIHTQFPEDVFPQVNLRTPYDTTRQPAPPGTAHSTGCYGDGKFVFASSNATLSLNTAGMMEDETYVVFVIIRKGARRALQYQVVEVIQGDPPVSRLE